MGRRLPRFEDVDPNSFALVSFDEVSRAVEAQRRAAAEKLEAKQRAAHELKIAMQVQARLFPQQLPPMRTLEYQAMRPDAPGGRRLLRFPRPRRDRLGLVIGDIAGKGMPAALLMANLQANLRGQCATAVEEPERFLETVSRVFDQEDGRQCLRDLFLLGVRRSGRERLRYANCGHLPALVLRRTGDVERLEPTATVLVLVLPRGSAGRRSSGFQLEIFWQTAHRWDHRGLRRPGRRVRGRTARRDAARAS